MTDTPTPRRPATRRSSRLASRLQSPMPSAHGYWGLPIRRVGSARRRRRSILVPHLAAIGEHVLIVDLDPQGNASTGLGIERKSRRTSTYDVLTGAAPMRDAVLQTAVPQLFIAPSTLDLSGLELEIGQQRDRAFRLRNALRAAQQRYAQL